MKRAIFYIPGSSQHFFEQGGSLIADRILRSLLATGSISAPCRIAQGDERKPAASTIPMTVATIETKADGQWLPVIDLIELQYLPAFTERYDGQTSLGRAAHAALVFATNIRRGLRTAFIPKRPKKDGWDRLQGIFTIWIILLSFGSLAYWGLLGATAVLGLEQITDIFPGERNQKFFAWLASIAALLTVGGLAIKELLGKLEKSAIEYYSIVDHLCDSRPSAKIENTILDVVEELTASGTYEHVDLLCFSLGALITCDTMFPRRPRLRRSGPQAMVSTLITIGYPYDIIATAYPDYFDRRQTPSFTARRWVNVDLDHDFLGSNFRRDSRAGPPEFGIGADGAKADSEMAIKPTRNLRFKPDKQPRPRGLLDLIPFTRTPNHLLYWDAADARAKTCFQEIVPDVAWGQDFTAAGAPLAPANSPNEAAA